MKPFVKRFELACVVDGLLGAADDAHRPRRDPQLLPRSERARAGARRRRVLAVPADPTCGALDGLETSISEHPDVVASIHALPPPPPDQNYYARYDVLENLPAGETVHVRVVFPGCESHAEPMWQLPPLIGGHAHVLSGDVGAVGFK